MDDLAAVVAALRSAGHAVQTPVSSCRIGDGQSNLTSELCDAAGSVWILREPPPGAHSATAHDVHREARIVAALAATPIPVPAVAAVGGTGNGRPFFVMSRVPGRALATEGDAATLPPETRARLARRMVEVLATVHALDPETLDIPTRPSSRSFLERQLTRLAETWQAWGADSSVAPQWERLRARLERQRPSEQRRVLVHGDYRLPNVLVDRGELTAVLDWELSAVGDPLVDLAGLVDEWRGPQDPAISSSSPTRVGGFGTRDEVVGWYAARSDLDLSRLEYYRAFTHFRAATLLQSVVGRRRSGALGEHGAVDPYFVEWTIAHLIDGAGELLS